MSNARYPRGVGWLHLVTLLVPVVLVLTVVRLLLTPTYLQLAYRMPGFPADPFGMTRQERLYWAEKARQYLLRPVDIDFLAELRFEDGRPVFNARELAHMEDVKRVVQGTLRTWYAALAGLGLLAFWAYRQGQQAALRRALRRGGWLTIILMGLLALSVLLTFTVFFVAFHQVFFDPGTWVFDYRDTLIRLFPERFWQDVFLIGAALSIVLALLLILLTPEKKTPEG